MAANTVTWLAMNRKFGVKILTRTRYFLVSETSRPARLPTQPKFHAYCRSFLGIKRLGREALHSPISSAEVKNEWSCNSSPLCGYMSWTRTSLLSFLRYYSTLKMRAVGSCETFVPFCLTVKSRILESIFCGHRHETHL